MSSQHSPATNELRHTRTHYAYPNVTDHLVVIIGGMLKLLDILDKSEVCLVVICELVTISKTDNTNTQLL
jgi:hypothetical protein